MPGASWRKPPMAHLPGLQNSRSANTRTAARRDPFRFSKAFGSERNCGGEELVLGSSSTSEPSRLLEASTRSVRIRKSRTAHPMRPTGIGDFPRQKGSFIFERLSSDEVEKNSTRFSPARWLDVEALIDRGEHLVEPGQHDDL